MEERRRSPRARCLLGAKVSFYSRRNTLSGTVRNQSERGLLVNFGEDPMIPNQIEVAVREPGEARSGEGRLARRRESRPRLRGRD